MKVRDISRHPVKYFLFKTSKDVREKDVYVRLLKLGVLPKTFSRPNGQRENPEIFL